MLVFLYKTRFFICYLFQRRPHRSQLRGDLAQQQGQGRQVQEEADRDGVLHGRHGAPRPQGSPAPARELHHLRQARHRD